MDGGLARQQHVGHLRDRHGGHDDHLLARTADGHVEAPLAALLPEHAEVAAEAAGPVAPEGGAEDDHVALVALHVLHVLDEEAHVLAVLVTTELLRVDRPEPLVAPGARLQARLDQIGLLAVEGHDADRRTAPPCASSGPGSSPPRPPRRCWSGPCTPRRRGPPGWASPRTILPSGCWIGTCRRFE